MTYRVTIIDIIRSDTRPFAAKPTASLYKKRTVTDKREWRIMQKYIVLNKVMAALVWES